MANRMRRYARMAMAANGGSRGNQSRNDRGRMEGGRMEMGYGGEMNYGAESRFRDRRGRWHYDNGRFAPRSQMNYGAESRYERRGGREPRSDYDGEAYGHWGPYGDDEEDDRVMNRIGFSLDGEMGHPWEFDREYRMDAGHRSMNEMDRKSSAAAPGRADSSNLPRLTMDRAKEWVASMQNADGSRGAHWTIEQTRQLQAQKGVTVDPVHFWVVMNMLYSDYCVALERAGISKPEAYADMAKAFLQDRDAHKDKLERYWCYIAKR